MAEVKDKKDISILLEGQLPEFVTYDHPKFKKFIEKYYEFMESHQIYFDGFTFNEFKILLFCKSLIFLIPLRVMHS